MTGKSTNQLFNFVVPPSSSLFCTVHAEARFSCDIFPSKGAFSSNGCISTIKKRVAFTFARTIERPLIGISLNSVLK